ncbi:class I SAM-dependent methyltransferase [Streptomyces sp. NPDC055099]
MPSTATEYDAVFNRRAWDVLGANRGGQKPALYWHFRDAPGPGVELLGPLAGAAIAELGCGNGNHLAYIAQHGIARGIGNDVSPVCIHQAATQHAAHERLEWWLGDAVRIAPHLPPLDAVFSVFGGLWFADPHQLLPALRQRLKPGGRLIFSCMTRAPGAPEGRRQMIVYTPATGRVPVMRWMYSIQGWLRILSEHGYRVAMVDDQPHDLRNQRVRSTVFTATARSYPSAR